MKEASIQQFLKLLTNIGRWWDETFGKTLLVMPAPYFSANNDEREERRIRWLGRAAILEPEAMSVATESQGWYLRSNWGLLEEFRWRMVCDQEVLALITDKLETVSQSEVSTITFCLFLGLCNNRPSEMRVLGVRSNVCHSGGGITVGGEHNHILSHIIQFGADVIF